MPDAHAKVDSNDPLFQRLRQLRDDAGTPPYREIGERAGMSFTTAHSVLRGHNRPRWDIVRAVTAALGGDKDEIKVLYDQMVSRARSVRRLPTAATPCPGCGCLIADEAVHAEACRGDLTGPPPLRVEVSMAPPIAEDSWLNDDRYAEFRAGYAYASGSLNALQGLARLGDPEGAYYVWAAIQRGIERVRQPDHH